MPNGIVTYVHHLRNGLRSIGHRVTVVASPIQSSGDTAGIFSIEAGTRTKGVRMLKRLTQMDNDPFAWPPRMIADTLMRIARADPIDIVEMEESFGWFAEVQQRVSMPVVTKLHGPAFLTQVEHARLSEELTQRIAREGSALQGARFVFAPSTDVITKTFDRYAITQLQRVVIPNPVVTPMDAQHIWRANHCDPRLLLFVGRFEKIKGADFLLRVFRTMLDVDPALRLMLVGPNDGKLSIDGKSMSLWELIDAWFGDEFKNAIDVRGALPMHEIQQLRTKAALTVVCSSWENQPNTALEAMAQGCPVVAVGVGGVSEVIEDGVTGILTPAGDVGRFAEAAMGVINDLERAAKIGGRAREYVRRAHDPAKIAQCTVEFYDSSRAAFNAS